MDSGLQARRFLRTVATLLVNWQQARKMPSSRYFIMNILYITSMEICSGQSGSRYVINKYKSIKLEPLQDILLYFPNQIK